MKNPNGNTIAASTAACEPHSPSFVDAVVAHHEHLEVRPEREGGAADLGPAEHCDRMVGRERKQARKAIGGVVVAHDRLGVPRRFRRLGRGEHARAEPPQRRAFRVVVQQPTTGHDERGRVVVELAEAVGSLGDQEPVVTAAYWG